MVLNPAACCTFRPSVARSPVTLLQLTNVGEKVPVLPAAVPLTGTVPNPATGGGGDDVIILGPGRDRGSGQGGDDVVDGNGGPDRLAGGGGQDFLRGFGGADVLNGGRNRDCLYAVDGVGGSDLAIGGPGTDFYEVDPGDQVESAEQASSCAGD